MLNFDRSVTWTSPAGHTYTDPPATYPIDGTSATYARNDNGQHSGTTAGPASAMYARNDNGARSGLSDDQPGIGDAA